MFVFLFSHFSSHLFLRNTNTFIPLSVLACEKIENWRSIKNLSLNITRSGKSSALNSTPSYLNPFFKISQFLNTFLNRYRKKVMGAGYSYLALPQWYREGTLEYGKAGYDRNRGKPYFDVTELQNISLEGKNIVITGANKGLGRAAADILAKMNANVHIFCRNAERGEMARKEIQDSSQNPNIFLHVVDVSNFGNVKDYMKNTFPSRNLGKVDVLINNAGVMPKERILTEEGKETSMATMIGGTYLLTSLMLPYLAKSDATARVINVSSGGAYTAKCSPTDLDCNFIKKYDGTLVYAINKRIQIIVTEIMMEKFSKTNKNSTVLFNSMHPGWCATDALKTAMPEFYDQQKRTLRTEEEGADTIVWMAASKVFEGKNDENNGKFWFDRRSVRTNFPFSGTDLSGSDRELLWKNIQSYCSYIFPN